MNWPASQDQLARSSNRAWAGALPRRSHGAQPSLPATHPVLYALLRALLRPVFRAYFRVGAEGLEHLPKFSAFILASNHVSMLDWAHIAYFLPWCVRDVIDREMLDQLPIRIGCWINGSVAVRSDRPDSGGLRAALFALALGEPLIIFPEGQISLTGRPQAGRPGVIGLAALAGVPIVPVALRGAFEAFPRWKRLPRPGRVTVIFGKPLPPPPRGMPRAAQQELADLLMARIAVLHDGTAPRANPW